MDDATDRAVPLPRRGLGGEAFLALVVCVAQVVVSDAMVAIADKHDHPYPWAAVGSLALAVPWVGMLWLRSRDGHAQGRAVIEGSAAALVIMVGSVLFTWAGW